MVQGLLTCAEQRLTKITKQRVTERDRSTSGEVSKSEMKNELSFLVDLLFFVFLILSNSVAMYQRSVGFERSGIEAV